MTRDRHRPLGWAACSRLCGTMRTTDPRAIGHPLDRVAGFVVTVWAAAYDFVEEATYFCDDDTTDIFADIYNLTSGERQTIKLRVKHLMAWEPWADGGELRYSFAPATAGDATAAETWFTLEVASRCPWCLGEHVHSGRDCPESAV